VCVCCIVPIFWAYFALLYIFANANYEKNVNNSARHGRDVITSSRIQKVGLNNNLLVARADGLRAGLAGLAGRMRPAGRQLDNAGLEEVCHMDVKIA